MSEINRCCCESCAKYGENGNEIELLDLHNIIPDKAMSRYLWRRLGFAKNTLSPTYAGRGSDTVPRPALHFNMWCFFYNNLYNPRCDFVFFFTLYLTKHRFKNTTLSILGISRSFPTVMVKRTNSCI